MTEPLLPGSPDDPYSSTPVLIDNLIHIVSGNRMAGAQSYALDICREYASRGVNTIALTSGAYAVDTRFSAHDIKVEHAPLRGFLDFSSILSVAGMMRRLPKGNNIIHAHRYRDAYTAAMARRLAKRDDIRIVATRHAVRKGRDSSVFRRLYANIDAHIFVSRLAFDRFCHSWEGRNLPLDDSKVFVLHDSIRTEDSTAPLPEPEKGPVTALYLGPVAERKGLETLIDALMLMRGVRMRLMIAGEGSPDFLDNLRKRAMIREVMDFIDWHSGAENPRELIARAHFGVVPSVESEAFGLSNLRYMACGRPQISTRNGAQTEYLIDGESALFVPPADSATLAEAMTRLASDPDLRARMGQKAFMEFSRNLSWENFIRKLDAIYEKCF